MSRFSALNVPITGTKDRDGTRARIRERDIVPVPFPVPFCPANVPLSVSGAASRNFTQRLSVHGVDCVLERIGGGGTW